jgi:pilus assembly protein CpaD
MKATLEAARLAKELGDNGVKSISTKVLPVSDSWNVSHTLVSYKTLSASAPSDCGRMPGFDSAADVGNFDKHDDYDYGCTLEAMIAKQIADPSDLLGVEDQTETDSGRRVENVLSGRGYYGAEQFPRLEGEQASE